jgi:predicted O-methyltransferase YrrM
MQIERQLMTDGVSLPNWFKSTPAEVNFTQYLTEFTGKKNLKFLQLGAFAGDASVWLMNNILTHKTSHLTDVDTWQGSDEQAHEVLNFSDVELVYNTKTSAYKNITKFKGTTLIYLKRAPLEHYDFIYVDADHTAVGVLLDAELSWLSLKSGGVLAFDDYMWRENMDREDLHPQPGINSFLERHQGEWEPILKNWQLWVRKK